MMMCAASRSSNAPHSGYQRIEAEQRVVLVDTGAAPPIDVSQDAHAGCLSFELSRGRSAIVVNCGLPAIGRENWRRWRAPPPRIRRVTFNDTASYTFQ